MKRHKPFFELSARQQQRRFSAIQGQHAVRDEDEGNAIESSDDDMSNSQLNSTDNITDDEMETATIEGDLPFHRLEEEMDVTEEMPVDNVSTEQLGHITAENSIDDVNVDDDLNLNYEWDLNYEMQQRLKNAFFLANLNHAQQKIILRTLREFPFYHTNLPKDPRTLQNTPTLTVRNVIQPVSGGQYLHLGVEHNLRKKLISLHQDLLPEFILLEFSTDGGRLYNSGDYQFWPIQFRIVNIHDCRPMFAGVFVGESKPKNVFDFFEKFIGEIQTIINRGGLTIGNKLLPLRIRCFVADAPARALALNHMAHNSAHPCLKCTIEGRSNIEEGSGKVMVFSGIGHRSRSNEEYQRVADEDHQKVPSTLADIMGLVNQVPFEPMHLIYLGLMKKILDARLAGKFGCRKFQKTKVDILDSRALILKSHCSKEFNRSLGILSKYYHFKAT